MIEFMLDTDICIYILQNRNAHLKEKFRSHVASCSISTITLAELHFGAANSAKRRENTAVIDGFAAGVSVLPFSEQAARHFGDIRAHLRRAGTPVGPPDLLIGAHARSKGLTLVTNNRREFDRIPDLRVENWAAG